MVSQSVPSIDIKNVFIYVVFFDKNALFWTFLVSGFSNILFFHSTKPTELENKIEHKDVVEPDVFESDFDTEP